MNTHKTIVALTFVALTFAFLSNEPASDPIMESFQRDFAHEPAAAAPATRADIDHDVLYQAFDEALLTYTQAAPLDSDTVVDQGED